MTPMAGMIPDQLTIHRPERLPLPEDGTWAAREATVMMMTSMLTRAKAEAGASLEMSR